MWGSPLPSLPPSGARMHMHVAPHRGRVGGEGGGEGPNQRTSRLLLHLHLAVHFGGETDAEAAVVEGAVVGVASGQHQPGRDPCSHMMYGQGWGTGLGRGRQQQWWWAMVVPQRRSREPTLDQSILVSPVGR
jgi:hypothetical protein